MLQIMRDKAQGWIAWILIGSIAIAFTFIGTGNFFNNDTSENVAKVNGKTISWQRFSERYEQVRAQNEAAASMDVAELKSMLLDNMVRELALMQASEKRGFRVSDHQINQLIHNINIFQENGQFSYERLNQLLQQLHLTEYEFYHQIQEMMMVAQIEEGLKNTAFSLTSDLSSHLKYINQKRHVKYVELDNKQFEAEVTVTEEELKAYYEAHPKEFMTSEMVQIDYIELASSSSLSEIEQVDAADQIVTLAYEHPDSLQPIVDNLDLVIKTSDFLTRKGGEGIFADPAVLAAIFSEDVLDLKQNSNLIKIEPDTYVVLRLKDHQIAKVKPFEQVKNDINILVRNVKLNDKLKAYTNTIVTILKQEKSLDNIASAKQLNFIDKTITRSEMGIDPALMKIAFTLPRPQENEFEVGAGPTKNGYAIVVMDQILDGQLVDVPADRLNFIQGFLANNLGEIDYDLYVSEIIKQANIEKHLPEKEAEKE